MSEWEEALRCGACGSDRATDAGTIPGHRYVRCLGCGVVRLHDRVAPASLHLLYSGYYAGADPSPAELRDRLTNPTFAHRREKLESLVTPAQRRILEIGCGDGNFLAYLRSHGWAVHGAEYDAGTAEIVARRHGIDVSVGDVVTHTPDGAPFDVVAGYHVLEHVYQPLEWLAALRAMIVPGGVLHLQVPNYDSLTRRLAGAAWASMIFPQHVYFYSPRTLSALLRRTGFVPMSISTWDPWHGPGTLAASVVNQARRWTTGRLPWSDVLGGGTVSCVEPAVVRAPRIARRILDALSKPLSRAEAMLGMGAVVDVIAVRSPT